MAAKAIEIQSTRRRKSRRIKAANKFLSNITLDGKLPEDKDCGESKTKHTVFLDKEETELISQQSLVQNLSVRTGAELSVSISTSNTTNEDRVILGIPPSPSLITSPESRLCYKRTNSFKENYHNVGHIFTGNLANYKETLCEKRIVLCSSHRVPFSVYSVLKYSQQQYCSDSMEKATFKLQKSSGERDNCFYGIKGIDIGSKDRPVSYGFLLSSRSWSKSCDPSSPHKISPLSVSPTCEATRNIGYNSPVTGITSNKTILTRDLYGYPCNNYTEYHPYLLDDPELRSGRHRKVLKLNSFMVSIIAYVKPSQLKKDLNEQFKEKFPNIDITLSKLRSLKNDISKLSLECSLDNSTVAYSIIYFEKLVLRGKINKTNRKFVVGSCLLLAAKFNSDLKKDAVKQLIENICDWCRVSAKDLLMFEIQSLIAMEFELHLPLNHVLPQMKRMEFENIHNG